MTHEFRVEPLGALTYLEDPVSHNAYVVLVSEDRSAYDVEFFEVIRDAFTSEEKYVREAAIWATAYSPWPQYRPLLEATAHNDPEPKHRTDATTILAGFAVHGL